MTTIKIHGTRFMLYGDTEILELQLSYEEYFLNTPIKILLGQELHLLMFSFSITLCSA